MPRRPLVCPLARGLLLTCAVTVLAAVVMPTAPVQAAPQCRSRSIGAPTHGRLVAGRRLPSWGNHYAIQPFTVRNGYVWGTCELIDGLRWVADELAGTLQGRPLALGNLSPRKGGEMPISSSHESGRDVDVAPLMADDLGRPIPSYYHHFDRDGISRSHGPRFRFDVARNWRLVEVILACPHFEVEKLVIAPYLRDSLLAYARQQNAAPELVGLAERKLVPPWPGVKLHDNHFHLRIACSVADLAAGCQDSMPQRVAF